jgi:hypothetical protein
VSRVDVKSELFRWARERARMDAAALVEPFPQYERWESGAELPTFKQLEMLARKTMTPFGYFFPPEPPKSDCPFQISGRWATGRCSQKAIESAGAQPRF